MPNLLTHVKIANKRNQLKSNNEYLVKMIVKRSSLYAVAGSNNNSNMKLKLKFEKIIF